MSRRVEHVIVAPRRLVAVHRTGTQSDRESAVVLCHSAPGAGTLDPDPAQTRAAGVTLLSVDRPGYGGSDPVGDERWATVASAADDVAAVLDSLRVGAAGVVGWSAGGRVALALAARRPDLVERVVVLATPAPDSEVPWLSPEQRALFTRLDGCAPRDARAELSDRFASLVPTDPFAEEALGLLAALRADEAALRAPGARTRLGEMLRVAFRQGAGGFAADVAGYCLQPWGFDPAAVEADTLLLYGAADPIAGPAHGSWWREQLPNARLEVVPRAGHLLVLPTWNRVLSHLTPVRGLGRPDGGSDATAA